MEKIKVGQRFVALGDTISPPEAYELCVRLAACGVGWVSPNPPVGCVILAQNGQLIGMGYHKIFGGPHAEVEALQSVSDKSALNGATVFVSLEPCSFHGKTPACAEMLVSYPIATVEYGQLDPNPKVLGQGVSHLQKHGKNVRPWAIASDSPLMQELESLVKPFFTNLIFYAFRKT